MTHLTPYILIFSPLIAFFIWSWVYGADEDYHVPSFTQRTCRGWSSIFFAAALIITGIVLLTK